MRSSTNNRTARRGDNSAGGAGRYRIEVTVKSVMSQGPPAAGGALSGSPRPTHPAGPERER